MALENHRIALLIDADNSPASRIDKVLAEVSTYGFANICMTLACVENEPASNPRVVPPGG